MDDAVAQSRDAAGQQDAEAIDRLCQALSVLRPFVPIHVLADVSNTSEAFVRSMASELANALLINDGAVQFRDEPTETWFQSRFRPTNVETREIADRLRPISSKSAYSSAVLPRLLLLAGQLDELVEMALSDEGLPKEDGIARSEAQLQRLRMAVQAALRADRFEDAAKLAFKTAGLVAAEDRQLSFLSSNPDLTSRFLEPAQSAELIAHRKIGGGSWFGSDNAHQAALFAGYEQFRGDGHSRLQAADEWLHYFFRRTTEKVLG